jgi:D-glycero-D-manno-heptose 1,7-bisphosphate phosphatase
VGVRPLRAVFFDRDGVINDATVINGVPSPPASLSKLCIVPDARSIIESLRKLSFATVIITNQPDVARGTLERETVEAINQEVVRLTGVDAVFTCFHDDADDCDCRKPKPGLIMQACDQFGIDPIRSYFVGDRTKDVLAGRAAGCTTVLIDRGYLETDAEEKPDIFARSLKDAVERILERERAPA